MVQIIHNPRCRKSREALELIHSKGITPNIILYLQDGLTRELLDEIVKVLNIPPSGLLRKSEDVYKTLIKDKSLSEVQIFDLMLENPILIERPIVISNNKAAIGRPPENILAIL